MGPLTKVEIARRSGVSLAGVVKALPRLLDTALVSPIGTGRRQVIAMRDAHPLAGMLHLLFRTEALQKQQLSAELTRMVAESRLAIRSAWIDEASRSTPRAPLTVGVLAGSGDVTAIQDELRPRLAEVSARFGVTLELAVRTVPDIAALTATERERLERVVPLYGPHPVPLAEAPHRAQQPKAARTHAERESQSLRRAMWIARLLDRDPSLPQRARTSVVHRLREAAAREAADLKEWLHLLDTAPISTLQYVLLRIDERSDRLRQTNPFIMALTPDERRRMNNEEAP
jgi:hypothetical protein